VFGKFHEARLALKNKGERTIINLLGPLLNPLNPRYQVIGVYDPILLKPMAEALHLLGREGFVVTSEGTDELTLNKDHQILKVRDSSIQEIKLDLPTLGFQYASISELKGGSPEDNAKITQDILQGHLAGPKRDVVLLNALLGERAYGA
jgi:anthranilate phosphoribosyltransferase